MLKLAIVSDIHMTSEMEDEVTDVLRHITAEIESFDPDRTVVLGDLIQDENEEADQRNINTVLDIFSPLSPRYLAGNHDSRHLSADELRSLLGKELWGHERLDNTNLVYLDTSAPHLPQARSEITDDQLSILSDVLDQQKDTLLFAHHPIHYHDISENVWFSEMPELAFCSNKEWLYRVMDKMNPVIATFNGHLHENTHSKYDMTDHFTVNAVNKERPGSDTVTGTYALISIGDCIEVNVYDRAGLAIGWKVPLAG
jgi:predicted phosphodiesterase